MAEFETKNTGDTFRGKEENILKLLLLEYYGQTDSVIRSLYIVYNLNGFLRLSCPFLGPRSQSRAEYSLARRRRLGWFPTPVCPVNQSENGV